MLISLDDMLKVGAAINATNTIAMKVSAAKHAFLGRVEKELGLAKNK